MARRYGFLDKVVGGLRVLCSKRTGSWVVKSNSRTTSAHAHPKALHTRGTPSAMYSAQVEMAMRFLTRMRQECFRTVLLLASPSASSAASSSSASSSSAASSSAASSSAASSSSSSSAASGSSGRAAGRGLEVFVLSKVQQPLG